MLIYKPVPSPIDKIKNKYRWNMIIKCKLNTRILDIIKYSIENDNISKIKNTSIFVDINPNNLI
jgi:primosomal protein N' (replication factor Y)